MNWVTTWFRIILLVCKRRRFYGWPYSYFGKNEDPGMKYEQKPELVNKSIVPDVPPGAHTASSGLAFYDKQAFPLNITMKYL
jgi:glucose/arabinose dehydrogenase